MVPVQGSFLRGTAIDRKLVFLRSTNIALAQNCASVIRIRKRRGPWLALVLVDPPIGNIYTTNDVDSRAVSLNLRPFLGNCESFLYPPLFSMYAEKETEAPKGMLDDLQQYSVRERPACFDPGDPSVQSLAYYSLRIIAAEWVKYDGVMQYCLKQYEYNHDQLPALSLEKFDRDFRELQSWKRRTMVSQSKIMSILRFLSPRNRHAERKEQEDLEILSEDFEHINENIDVVGRRLESMLPVVMSFVQTTDARRSFAETADIGRLTIPALVFVPFTFVSSLFSMSAEHLPGSGGFWVYFAVAIPLTFLVVLIARPPVALVRKMSRWIVDRWTRPVVAQHTPSGRDSMLKEPPAYHTKRSREEIDFGVGTP